MRCAYLVALLLMPVACTQTYYIPDGLRTRDRGSLAVIRFTRLPVNEESTPPYTRTVFELKSVDGSAVQDISRWHDKVEIFLEPGPHEIGYQSTRMQAWGGPTSSGGPPSADGSMPVHKGGRRPVVSRGSFNYTMEPGREYWWHEILVQVGLIKLVPDPVPSDRERR